MGRNRPWFNLADDRNQIALAPQQKPPKHQNGEQNVDGWPSGHYSHPLPDSFAIEGFVPLLLGHLSFTLIEHFDVAAQRDAGQGKLSPVAIVTAPDNPPETYRKAQHPHATEACDKKVTVF